MSVETSRKTTRTSYRTVNVASPEPTSTTTTSRTLISGGTVSPLPYATANGSYETVRYLVPMQQQPVQQQSFMLMQQPMVQQQMVQQQMMQPVYLQAMPHLSVSSHDSDLMYQTRSASVGGMSSVFSQSSKSPEPSLAEDEDEEEEEEEEEEVEVVETEIINTIQQKPPPAIGRITRTEVRTECSAPEPAKMDTRYFGELLADVYRKNVDIHSCIYENVSRIQGNKNLDSKDYKVQRDEVEALIPKGATELTKQQIRYLLQTRLTADKSMRLLLSTFSSLREELMHMSEDLRRLEGEKESLERDLSFKADQARQYDSLLEAVRENNRQLQISLKETTSTQRSLETQLTSSRSDDSGREFRLKELEGRIRTLEKENEMLRQKNAGQASSSSLHIKTEELSRQYKDQLEAMRREKDQEIQKLRTQITKITTEVHTSHSSSSSSEKTLQLKISELLAMLDQRQTTISRQEEEIRKLMMEKNSSSNKNVTKTVITKRYRNQYPILGLLGDDYQTTSSVNEARTYTVEST